MAAALEAFRRLRLAALTLFKTPKRPEILALLIGLMSS
jgi:hypothetical protein